MVLKRVPPRKVQGPIKVIKSISLSKYTQVYFQNHFVRQFARRRMQLMSLWRRPSLCHLTNNKIPSRYFSIVVLCGGRRHWPEIRNIFTLPCVHMRNEEITIEEITIEDRRCDGTCEKLIHLNCINGLQIHSR